MGGWIQFDGATNWQRPGVYFDDYGDTWQCVGNGKYLDFSAASGTEEGRLMSQRIPNTTSPTVLRQAWQRAEARGNVIREGAAGEILIGVAVGTNPAWGTDLTTLTS